MSAGTIGHRICGFGERLVNGVREGEKGGGPMRLGSRALGGGKRARTNY